jgi:hypothetical protein
MIDMLKEDLIVLRAACREKPFRHRRTGKPAHISSLYRHVMRGARAANGERIRLETVRTPSGLRTSREAIARFIQALTDPGLPLPTAAKRRQAQEAAETELRRAGFEIGGDPAGVASGPKA